MPARAPHPPVGTRLERHPPTRLARKGARGATTSFGSRSGDAQAGDNPAMKIVMAVIKPFKMEEVRDALASVSGGNPVRFRTLGDVTPRRKESVLPRGADLRRRNDIQRIRYDPERGIPDRQHHIDKPQSFRLAQARLKKTLASSRAAIPNISVNANVVDLRNCLRVDVRKPAVDKQIGLQRRFSRPDRAQKRILDFERKGIRKVSLKEPTQAHAVDVVQLFRNTAAGYAHRAVLNALKKSLRAVLCKHHLRVRKLAQL